MSIFLSITNSLSSDIPVLDKHDEKKIEIKLWEKLLVRFMDLFYFLLICIQK